MPDLRKDPISGRWVIIATERAKRPDDFIVEKTYKVEGFCPFCEGNESKTPPEVYAIRDGTEKDTRNWKIRVVPNKFPALSSDGDIKSNKDGIYRSITGIGRHEVIIETPSHLKFLHNMSEEEIELILDTYKTRYNDLKNDSRLRYILIFKNYGFEAGASLSHSHSQLIATPIVPKRVAEELYSSRNFYLEKRNCIFCEMISKELAEKVRMVKENEHFACFAPFASRFPFELWILPKRHNAFFEEINDEEIKSLVKIFSSVFLEYYKVLNDPAYNYIIHTAPIHMSGKWPTLEYDYHWHIEVIPKLTKVAGFEWGTGFYINPMPPEKATEFLKNAGGGI